MKSLQNNKLKKLYIKETSYRIIFGGSDSIWHEVIGQNPNQVLQKFKKKINCNDLVKIYNDEKFFDVYYGAIHLKRFECFEQKLNLITSLKLYIANFFRYIYEKVLFNKNIR